MEKYITIFVIFLRGYSYHAIGSRLSSIALGIKMLHSSKGIHDILYSSITFKIEMLCAKRNYHRSVNLTQVNGNRIIYVNIFPHIVTSDVPYAPVNIITCKTTTLPFIFACSKLDLIVNEECTLGANCSGLCSNLTKTRLSGSGELL